jgi:hypothetical protein
VSLSENLEAARAKAKAAIQADLDITKDSDGKILTATLMKDSAWGENDWKEWLREKGTDPETVTFTFGVTSNPSGGYWNKLLNVKPKPSTTTEVYSLQELYKAVENSTPTPRSRVSTRTATVVCLADWQLGKTGRRGGTEGTLQRLAGARATLERLYAERKPEKILLFDLGDGIEGFESGGDPQFTNDLSLPDQLDAYSTEMFKFIEQAYRFAKVEVAAVPSNHSSWRRGKQSLGKPADDFGLYVHREVGKVSKAAGYDVQWHFPEPYDETVCVDLFGTPVGGVHGNQFGPGRAVEWWQAQTFGSQAITKADILLTGHYHTFGSHVAGINAFTGRERMWLGCPTVDPGSDWYRAIRGRDSLPATLVFDVSEEGFDLGSLDFV